LVNVPSAIDVMQSKKPIEDIPEIRVWCCPHRQIGGIKPEQKGDDYYEVFGSFKEALAFIDKHPEAENEPLIAFKGFELNIFDMKSAKEIKPMETSV
jgi:hypothetical protein